MSEFTAEDFARAEFAKHDDGRKAMRDLKGVAWQWSITSPPDSAEAATDRAMARDGWVPVVESRITEHTLRDAQEKAARKREKMIQHIEDLNAAMRRKNERIKLQNAKLAAAEARIKELRRENRRLDAEADGAISLDGLSAAWEAAEVPTSGFSAGDLCIERCADDHYEVFRASSDMAAWSGDLRILSRAPKPREPWQDLADDLAGEMVMSDGTAEAVARALRAAGWRKTGGEEA